MSNLIRRNTILVCVLLLHLALLTACAREQSIKEEDVSVSDSVAALLYSSDGIDKKFGPGVTYLFLVKEDGSISVIKQKGLELNSLIPHEDRLLLHQENEWVEIKDQSIQRTEIEDCAATAGYGQASGILDRQGLHYSLFNIGFTDDMNGYISTIRWGDKTSNYCGEIGSYIEAIGSDGESLFLFAGHPSEPWRMDFRKVTFAEGKLTESAPVELYNMESDSRIMFTRFISYEDRLVGIFSDSSSGNTELGMLEIDPAEPNRAKIHPLKQYPGNTADYFFYNKDSIHVHNNRVYYVDGYGDVYAYDLENENLEKVFHFQDYTRTSLLQDEQVFFKDERIYFFRMDNDRQGHQLETYTLAGERKSVLPVKGISDHIGKDNVHIYDFKML